MAQSAVTPLPNWRPTLPQLARSNSLISNASEASTNSRASLRRRSRTRTRRKSVVGDNRSGGEERSSRHEDAPPLPPLNLPDASDNITIPQVDSPESMQYSREGIAEAERRLGVEPEKRQAGRARALSSVNVRDVPELARGRQTKSENGSVRGVCLSLMLPICTRDKHCTR